VRLEAAVADDEPHTGFTGGPPPTSRPPHVTHTTRIEVSSSRGVFMISVAAELADMHPQTLRMYEQRGLIQPQRSPRGTRLYSQDDVDRLRQIQEMTASLGLNLAGVERVLALEARLAHLERRYAAVERRRLELEAEVQRLRDNQRTAVVRWQPPR
jgi:MerR family transcriptional regulator/heat shock protein HspR